MDWMDWEIVECKTIEQKVECLDAARYCDVYIHETSLLQFLPSNFDVQVEWLLEYKVNSYYKN